MKDMKEKKQDSTLLLLAMGALIVVAHIWMIIFRGDPAPVRRVITASVQADVVSQAVKQDLTKNREGFEGQLKKYLFVSADAEPVDYKDIFSESAWRSYQGYLATRRSQLKENQILTVEFIFGSQKYTDMIESYIAFQADGLFCYDGECGTEKFKAKILLKGDLAAPASVMIEEFLIDPY